MALVEDDHVIQTVATNRTYNQECPEYRPIQQRKVRRVTRGRAETRIDTPRAVQKTSRW